MIVENIPHGRHVLRTLEGLPWLALDSETKPRKEYEGQDDATLIHGRHTIFVFSLCHRGVAYSFPTNLVDPKFPSISEWMHLFNEFALRNPDLVWVMHNANYDIRAFTHCGWLGFRRVWDTLIAGWMANANEDKSLKARAPLYGRFQRATKTVDFSSLPDLADYAEGDVIVTDEMYQAQIFGEVVRPAMLQWMTKSGDWSKPTKNLVGSLRLPAPPGEELTPFDRLFLRAQELPVLFSTLEAENNGLPVNRARLLEARRKADADLAKVTRKIFRAAGKTFNLNSRKQKAEVLESLGVAIGKRTPSGDASVNYESMLEMKGQHDIVESLIEHAKISKLVGTYIGPNGLEHYINPKTGCIHPNLNTVGAVTGRSSSSNPNCQNIPARNDRYGIKNVFEAPLGDLFICMDFSQIELRVMAMLSEDPRMSEVLNDPDGDIHTATSVELEIPRDPAAKQCNFLLIFGGGARALQQRLKLEGHNVSKSECEDWISKFDQTYPRVRAFREECFRFHEINGYIPLLTGRRRVIENMTSSDRYLRHMAETQLANNLVQGSAQDLLKALIVRASPNRPNFDRVLPGILEMPREHRLLLKDYARKVEKFRREFRLGRLKWRLQVHDESLYTADKHAALDLAHRISEMMTWKPYWPPVYKMDVAVRGDGGVGLTWALAKKPKEDKFKVHSPL